MATAPVANKLSEQDNAPVFLARIFVYGAQNPPFVRLFCRCAIACSAFAYDSLSLPPPGSPESPTATQPAPIPAVPSAPDVGAKAYILIDAYSGRVLAEKNADEKLPPASLTKMMTMYVVSDALSQGRIRLTDEVTVSEDAWRTGGSKMFIKVGDKVKIEDLIQGIIIVSGNDACVAMAEHLAGSEKAFTDSMNAMAQHLGMTSSHFTDSTGMPHPEHYTTARTCPPSKGYCA